MLLTSRTILQSVISRNSIFQSVIRRNYLRPNMPMTSGALKLLQKTKKTKRDRQGQHVPANVYFQIVGNGAPGCSKSVYLHTDHNRYLFNCGEMCQKVISFELPTPYIITKSQGVLFVTHFHLLDTCICNFRAGILIQILVHTKKKIYFFEKISK